MELHSSRELDRNHITNATKQSIQFNHVIIQSKAICLKELECTSSIYWHSSTYSFLFYMSFFDPLHHDKLVGFHQDENDSRPDEDGFHQVGDGFHHDGDGFHHDGYGFHQVEDDFHLDEDDSHQVGDGFHHDGDGFHHGEEGCYLDEALDFLCMAFPLLILLFEL